MRNLPWVSDEGPVSEAQQLQIIMPRSLKKKPVTVLNFID